MTFRHFVAFFLKPVLRDIKNNRALFYLKKNKGRKAAEIIRVAFIVFEPESWDKLQPIYEEMTRRKEFEPQLVVVPSFDVSFSIGQYSYEREFFKKKYGEIIEAIDENGNTIDLESYRFDYVFYQDPYNSHFPKELQSNQVVKYSKICYIPYGYTVSDNFSEIYASNIDFFRNVAYFFADTRQNGKIIEKLLNIGSKNKLQKVEYLGYPPFEEYFKWEKREKVQRITWAPRWSYDEKVGGSHFIEYKNNFVELRKLNNDINLLLRPHPMLFANMIETKKMNSKDVEEYKNDLKNNNIEINDRGPIDDVLNNTDLLIADISSIDASYFVTGRPLIYCKSNLKPNDEFKKMLEGIYVAESWDDVQYYVNEIVNGNDYLYDKRMEILKENEFIMHSDATNNIVNFLERELRREN